MLLLLHHVCSRLMRTEQVLRLDVLVRRELEQDLARVRAAAHARLGRHTCAECAALNVTLSFSVQLYTMPLHAPQQFLIAPQKLHYAGGFARVLVSADTNKRQSGARSPQSTGPLTFCTSKPRAISASSTLASCMYRGAPRQLCMPMPNVPSACGSRRFWAVTNAAHAFQIKLSTSTCQRVMA